MPLIYSIAIQSFAMALTVLLIPKLKVSGIAGPVWMVVALTLVNSYLWDPTLFFTVPDSFTGYSLALVFCNGLLFLVLAKLLPGIDIEGVFAAFIAPILFTILSMVSYRVLPLVDWMGLLQQGKSAVEGVRDEIKKEKDATDRERRAPQPQEKDGAAEDSRPENRF